MIAGSFQLVIWPVKILASVSPVSRRLVTLRLPIFRLYMNAVPPATIGTYEYAYDEVSMPPPNGSGVVRKAMSEAAKSAWFLM